MERPGSGGDTRAWGPPFAQRGDGTGDSAYFLSANRGKRSITVDFTQERGRGLVRALAAHSDVLIENFKVGSLARYGLDYVSLCREHPGLVYCSITGFGQTGPERERSGYDLLIQARGGLMSITGDPDGSPTKVGVAVTDVFADPQIEARGMRLDLPDGCGGSLPGVACPVRFAGEARSQPLPPPRLGEHTGEVLRDELGLTEDAIAELRRFGVV